MKEKCAELDSGAVTLEAPETGAASRRQTKRQVGTMKRYLGYLVTIEYVARASYIVEAENEEQAEERYWQGSIAATYVPERRDHEGAEPRVIEVRPFEAVTRVVT
jgi:hypothetical protein